MKIIGEYREIFYPYKDITILDKNVAGFYLEKLNNCSIIEAFNILKYKRKYNKDFFCLYWNSIFKNSPKYLQRIGIRNRWKSYILIENLIAEYLIRSKKVSFHDSWIYAGYHEFSGNRIIAGQGKGVILSRFLQTDLFQETENTRVYLKRLGIHNPKIFTSIESFPNSEVVDLGDILDFAEKTSSVKSVFKNDFRVVNFILWMIVLILGLLFSYLSYEIHSRHLDYKNLNGKISNENLTVYLTKSNHESLKKLVDNMNDVVCWGKISEFCKKNNIKVHQLDVSDGIAKISTQISLENLKKLKDVKTEYSKNSEYEQLGMDQIAEATLWIRVK